MSNEKILVVDDDNSILEVIQMRLKAWGYNVAVAKNGTEAKAALSSTPFNLVIIDLRLSEEDGLDLMEEILTSHPNLPIIILTAHGTIESAVEAMRKGAYSYLTKPFDPRALLLQIERALENHRLTSEVKRLKGLLEERYDFANIVAKSEKMRSVLEQVAHSAKTEST